jgi:2'-5' RNA ligase
MDNSTNLDFSYEEYQERQLLELTNKKIVEKALALKKANLFVHQKNDWEAKSYEGFGMITMLSDSEQNKNLCSTLISLQKELLINTGSDNILYNLPPESFHQTIANILSNHRYQQQLIDQKLLEDFTSIIDAACNNLSQIKAEPIKMRMQGITFFNNAIGILGIFDKVSDYKRITDFRASFYGHAILEQVEVKMIRPFIGHITLAYIESDMSAGEKITLSECVIKLNSEIEKAHLLFTMPSTTLTYFMHLNNFSKKAHFANINL